MTLSTFAARWILPISTKPIENGEVVVDDGLIIDVRPRRAPANECRDFGDAILMPAFVNAHTHLEYTAQRGFLEDVPFFPWVRALTAAKRYLRPEDWLWSARLGALESVVAGIGTIGDNTDAGVTMQVAHESGLRANIYQEVFGIDGVDTPQQIVKALDRKITDHRRYESERVRCGVSPHALYTVSLPLFTELASYTSRKHLPTSVHVAESVAESQLTADGVGPFAQMFERRGIRWSAPQISPTKYADIVGALNSNTLAIHCVHQTDDDIELLAKSGAAIVHCPKSNGKLAAGIAPLAKWLRTEGLRVALGTDSVVSNNTLDMFEEMRFAIFLQRANLNDVECVTARDVLRMATLGGAEAMGLAAVTGSLTAGKRADLAAIGLGKPHNIPATDPYAALVYSASAQDVVYTMCNGVTLYDTGIWPTMDAAAIIGNTVEIRDRLSRENKAL